VSTQLDDCHLAELSDLNTSTTIYQNVFPSADLYISAHTKRSMKNVFSSPGMASIDKAFKCKLPLKRNSITTTISIEVINYISSTALAAAVFLVLFQRGSINLLSHIYLENVVFCSVRSTEIYIFYCESCFFHSILPSSAIITEFLIY